MDNIDRFVLMHSRKHKNKTCVINDLERGVMMSFRKKEFVDKIKKVAFNKKEEKLLVECGELPQG